MRIQHLLRQKKVNRSLGGNIALFLFLCLLSVVMILPLYLLVISAFKPIEELFAFPPQFYVMRPTLRNFDTMYKVVSNMVIPFSRYAYNSIYISVVTTFLHVIFASLAAYALAKGKFPGSRLLFNLVLWSLLFSAPVTAVPRYFILAKSGLLNTHLAVILPQIQSTLGLFLMKQFMENISDSILEAARIDGAGEMRLFWTIAMPQVKPAWLTLVIFAFQNVWADSGATVLFDETLKTIPVALAQLQNSTISRVGAISAASLVMIIPPVLVFVFNQSRVIETMSSSGIKE